MGLTPEELEEIRKREERKDRLHQNYLKRKANGKQKEYEAVSYTHLDVYKRQPVKRGSFRALYLYYLYLLSPRKKRPQKVPFETRAEIRRAKQYQHQFFLLQKYHIDTKPELEMLSDALSNEMQIIRCV